MNVLFKDTICDIGTRLCRYVPRYIVRQVLKGANIYISMLAQHEASNNYLLQMASCEALARKVLGADQLDSFVNHSLEKSGQVLEQKCKIWTAISDDDNMGII